MRALPIPRALFQWLRRQAARGVTLIALESGAWLLARAGLLRNRRATTHWSVLAGFAEQFPDIAGVRAAPSPPTAR